MKTELTKGEVLTHDELIERLEITKVLVRGQIGYERFKSSWIPEEGGYIYESRTTNGKCEWYRPVNL